MPYMMERKQFGMAIADFQACTVMGATSSDFLGRAVNCIS
jgi:hypothetical protein